MRILAFIVLLPLLGTLRSFSTQIFKFRAIDALHGFTLIGYPPVAVFLISHFNVALSEIQLIASLYLPAFLFGIANLISTNENFSFRLSSLFILSAPVIATGIAITSGQSYLYPLAWLSLAIPCLVTRRADSPSEVFINVVRLSFFSFLMMLFTFLMLTPGAMRAPCRNDKCTAFGFFIGPGQEQSNLLAIYCLAFGVFYLYSIVSKKRLILDFTIIGIVLYFLGGRTSLATYVVVFLAILFLRISNNFTRLVLQAGLIVGGIAVSLIPLLFSFTNNILTGRPIIWSAAKYYIGESPWFGNGPSFWVRLPETTSLYANYSPHNIWLELLVSIGFIGTALFVLGLIFSIKLAPHEIQKYLYLASLLFLITGVSEALIQPYRLTLVPGLLLFLLKFSNTKTEIDLKNEIKRKQMYSNNRV